MQLLSPSLFPSRHGVPQIRQRVRAHSFMTSISRLLLGDDIVWGRLRPWYPSVDVENSLKQANAAHALQARPVSLRLHWHSNDELPRRQTSPRGRERVAHPAWRAESTT